MTCKLLFLSHHTILSLSLLIVGCCDIRSVWISGSSALCPSGEFVQWPSWITRIASIWEKIFHIRSIFTASAQSQAHRDGASIERGKDEILCSVAPSIRSHFFGVSLAQTTTSFEKRRVCYSLEQNSRPSILMTWTFCKWSNICLIRLGQDCACLILFPIVFSSDPKHKTSSALVFCQIVPVVFI